MQKFDLAEEFFFESKNFLTSKHLLKQHLIHYDEKIQELMSSQPQLPMGEIINCKFKKLLNPTLKNILQKRKSERNLLTKAVKKDELLNILYYSVGVKEGTLNQKYVPSSGGLCSTDIYVIANNVTNLEPGIYFYNALQNNLILMYAGDFHIWLQKNVFFQKELAMASVAVVLTSNFGKLRKKYGSRAFRLGFLDGGHVSQNIYLLATSLNINVCATAGFIDDEVNLALNINGLDIAAILMLLIGK